MVKSKKSSGIFERMLNWTEKAGNALPHPATLFALFAFAVLVFSAIGYALGWEVIHPGTKETITPVNLLSHDGIHRILLEMVDNFTGFAPLGIVLVAMLGIGIAEQSGLINAIIRSLVLNSPKRLLTFVLVFTGILSNVASDVGYILLIPLAGVIFIAVGRHPIAGMAAAFAGVSGGFSANLVLGTVDPLLAGLSQEAARILDPSYTVNPTANYYFMVVSTLIIAVTGTFITEKIVEPRLGTYTGKLDVKESSFDKLSKKEKKGLRMALVVMIVIIGITLIGIIPPDGFFRGQDGTLLNSPLIRGVVAMLFITAGATGLAYGFTTGTFKNDSDVMNGMAASMKTLATYLVLVFFAAQFVAYFKWSNLGIILAVKGAGLLMSADIGLIPLMILFILLSASINMLMGSASAKWAILAPIFIPMFMIMGYSPELSQVVYRIGDSVTNVISPMMSFFALIIAFVQKYEPKSGIGTIIATMVPYSIAFLVVWILLLVAWLLIGLPLGPDAGIHYLLAK
ncbi:MAG: AbgT family transporter [Bacteroidetes bacterium]|jgi:aminobenzoyl-glutamate transport protein|nr:AbgT family transporter [Bacteroidota bacterium]MBT3751039.1 AbgT family transporter [Bacteroidota bacterium]MBT4399956.1 AbgT family transporter [Bacteroidota bacterium]MBT4412176.1 AbgT family transporter [Bacteroidota bacterium]MBT7466301.1 AbgT family transporter [Bacteroidota bacterium]